MASPQPPTHFCGLQVGNPQEAFCCLFIRLLRNKHIVSPTEAWRKDHTHSSDYSCCTHACFEKKIYILHSKYIVFETLIIKENTQCHAEHSGTDSVTHYITQVQCSNISSDLAEFHQHPISSPSSSD